MPLKDGLTATRYVQVSYPAIRVLMLSGYGQVRYVTGMNSAATPGRRLHQRCNGRKSLHPQKGH
jgi:hypothetical protein